MLTMMTRSSWRHEPRLLQAPCGCQRAAASHLGVGQRCLCYMRIAYDQLLLVAGTAGCGWGLPANNADVSALAISGPPTESMMMMSRVPLLVTTAPDRQAVLPDLCWHQLSL
jgi:hypothetical protein